MKPVSYLAFNGVEIANVNRTSVYINRLLDDHWSAPRSGGPDTDPSRLDCYCGVSSESAYTSPAADSAPWYDGTGPSAEFLGLDAFEIVLSPVAKRSTTPRRTGSVVGALRAGARVIAVTAYMYASSARGMVFGEDWLLQQLSGSTPGCSDDVLTILRSCDEGAFADLRQVGLVDGPVPSQVLTIPECHMQQISFQLLAGWPYLIGALQPIEGPTVLSTSVCGEITGAAGKTTAGKLTIVAGTADVTGLHIYGEPCAGYTDTYSDIYDPYLAGSGTIVNLLVGTLPAGSTFVLDGIDHTATLTDSSGHVIGGLDLLSAIGPFAWPEVTNGAVMCLCVVAGTVNAGTKVTVEAADLSL
jgi:hypothetical protein